MTLPDYAGCQKLAKNFNHQTGAFIGGEYVSSISGETYETINPATEEVSANIAACGEHDLDAAVKSARDTFNKGSWSRMAARDRGVILQKLASLVLENANELALMECLNVGNAKHTTPPITVCKHAVRTNR